MPFGIKAENRPNRETTTAIRPKELQTKDAGADIIRGSGEDLTSSTCRSLCRLRRFRLRLLPPLLPLRRPVHA